MSKMLVVASAVLGFIGIVAVMILGGARLGEPSGLIAIGLLLAGVSIVLRRDINSGASG
jgi:hypothetical protein